MKKRILASLVVSFMACGICAEEQVDHPSTDGAELRYKGASVPVREVTVRMSPGAPTMSEEEYLASSKIGRASCRERV